jgi:hypothetical protein
VHESDQDILVHRPLRQLLQRDQYSRQMFDRQLHKKATTACYTAPGLEAVRVIDMSACNSRAEFAAPAFAQFTELTGTQALASAAYKQADVMARGDRLLKKLNSRELLHNRSRR